MFEVVCWLSSYFASYLCTQETQETGFRARPERAEPVIAKRGLLIGLLRSA